MKIITMKKRKAKGTYDMFAVLSITQLILVILIVLAVFCVSRTDSSAFSGLLQDVKRIFNEDIDIGGYFTPKEENDEAASYRFISSVEEGNAVIASEEKEEAQKSEDKISVTGKAEDCDDIFGVFSSGAVMPVSGYVTSDYGLREHPIYSGESFHYGRDIAADEGSNIYAVLDGIVTEAGTAPQAGNFVKISHGDGIETLYCHCSELYVEKGISVRKGDVIAAVGETGLATGPHLHFELHENQKAVDPAKILSEAVSVY